MSCLPVRDWNEKEFRRGVHYTTSFAKFVAGVRPK
jgi:hypothetical protein